MSSRAEEDEYQDPNSKVCSILIIISLWHFTLFWKFFSGLDRI
jgi:hypothetical protein